MQPPFLSIFTSAFLQQKINLRRHTLGGRWGQTSLHTGIGGVLGKKFRRAAASEASRRCVPEPPLSLCVSWIMIQQIKARLGVIHISKMKWLEWATNSVVRPNGRQLNKGVMTWKRPLWDSEKTDIAPAYWGGHHHEREIWRKHSKSLYGPRDRHKGGLPGTF